MLFNKISLGLRQPCFSGLRSIYLSGINFEGSVEDPVQKLFLEKLKEYKEKSAGGKMFEPTPEIEKELKSELERINKQHGGDGNTDLSSFPEFKFPEVTIDPIISEKKEEK